MVQEVLGSEELADGVLNAACLDILQTLSDHQRLSLDLFKSLKIKYPSLTQNNTQKLFKLSKELIDATPKDIMKQLKCDTTEDDLDEGDYFGKNIPFHVDNSDYYTRFDLSYLRPAETTDFSLNDKISFNIEDHLRQEEEARLRASTSSGVDTQWLEDTVKGLDTVWCGGFSKGGQSQGCDCSHLLLFINQT